MFQCYLCCESVIVQDSDTIMCSLSPFLPPESKEVTALRAAVEDLDTQFEEQ